MNRLTDDLLDGGDAAEIMIETTFRAISEKL